MNSNGVIKAIFAIVFVVVPTVMLAQGPDSTDTDNSAVDLPADDSSVPTAAENCVNISRAKDIVVIGDQHVYVRTIANNEYLMTMGRICRNLKRSYYRGTVRFQPFGRDICSGDGSHFIYDDGGRQAICPVLRVQVVADLAAAQEIAIPGPSPVTAEPVILPE